MRPQPDQRVLAWANSLDPEGAAITAMNEAEILHSLAPLPDGRRKQALRESWDALAAKLFAGRVWAFTSEVAHWYGELVSHRERLAWQIATADAVIAANALAHAAPLATRNTSDFADLGLQLINPWTIPVVVTQTHSNSTSSDSLPDG